jgi:YVTN family beta-propeller protein
LCCFQAGNKVYCADDGAEDVAVIDGSTNRRLGYVDVLFYPNALDCDQARGRVYCSCRGSDVVTVIDAWADTVLASVPVGYGPAAVCYDSLHGKAYCANRWDRDVSVIDGTTFAVLKTIPVDFQPSSFAANPAYSRIYVAASENRIAVLRDTSTAVQEVAQADLRDRPSPSIIRSVLRIGNRTQNTGYRGELLDASGRKVLDLHPGVNDVSHLAAGIYFVREAFGVTRHASSIERQESSVTKVVIQH